MRILIADDHALLSESLRMMLEKEDGIEVVGLAYDGSQAVAMCKTEQPDMVLMDVRMPLLDGISATKRIKVASPDTKVLILTSLEEGNCVTDSFASGADGYLLKDTPPDQLIMLIRCVNMGYVVTCPVIRDYLVSASKGEREGARAQTIKDEDLQMIRLVSEGKSNNEIADIMNYAVGTVKNRITRIIELTGVENRAQLVIYALKNNLL